MRQFASESFVDSLRQKAATAFPKRVVLPETQDVRVLEAAKTLIAQKLVTPVLLDNGTLRASEVPAGAEVLTISSSPHLEKFAETLYAIRKHKGLTLEKARELAASPLVFAGMMLRTGDEVGCVAGSEASTGDVIRAGLMTVGLKPGIKTLSSCFVMVLPDRIFTFADCGVVPQPSPEQLADIAAASAESHRLLVGETPKVALLSHSSKGSADNDDVSKVKRAGEILRRNCPELLFEEELQLDAAIVPTVAKKKAPASNVAGDCNVLVFPDLDAGNIGYKLTERLAGAKALGPLIQGLKKPYMDLSRGCSVDDIVTVACIASIL